jgi:endonuclease/exonuclease/phosphatase family metal-dependent hydrolase
MKLTCATWNIATGSTGPGSGARLRRRMAVLAALAPSVAALQECTRWDRDHYRALHLAEHLLGMRGYLSTSPHDGCHLAVFVRDRAGLRVTEQRHENQYPYWHGAARVVVTADGYPHPLQLASVHLAPSSPAIRLAEAEAFALVAGKWPVIAGGDWNALPAHDPEPGTVPGRQQRKLDRRAAQALEQAGLLDAGDCAADLTPTVGHDRGLACRCDRTCTTLPAHAITGYQVITTADAESGHRPVIAEFDLTPTTGHVRGNCR